MKFPSTRVYRSSDGGTLWVPLPSDLQEPIASECDCQFCKTHPDAKPMWDTLALRADGTGHTWTVHYPELTNGANK
jgi:hypothetical protein